MVGRFAVFTRGVVACALIIIGSPESPPPTGLASSHAAQRPDTSRPLSEGGRLVRFRTSEGTWISLDVSPDGKTLVFDLLGSLYLLPISGGTAHPLTSGPAFDAQPKFSPNGLEVAFISDRQGVANLWVVGIDGRHPRRVSDIKTNLEDSPICSPVWSPDGHSIIVSQRRGTVERVKQLTENVLHRYLWLLAAYDATTGAMRWLSDTSVAGARQTLGPAFHPNGATVFAAVQPAAAGAAPSPYAASTWHIERVDVATGHIDPEMSPWLGRSGVRPVLSPDGRTLAYASFSGSRLGIRLRDLRTYRERWLVRDEVDVPDFWTGGADGPRDHVPGYAFTPDSKALVIALHGRIWRIAVATGRRRNVPFVVNVARELPPLTVHQYRLSDTPVRTHSVMQPALSPDGATVAFSALDRIWLMDLPDSGQAPGLPRRLTSDTGRGEFYPSWSPDGRWIAYSIWRDGEGGAVRRAPVQPTDGVPGPSLKVSHEAAVYFNVAVGPDGDRILALRSLMAPEQVLTHWHAKPPDGLEVVALRTTDDTALMVNHSSSREVLFEWRNEWSNGSRAPTDELYFTTDPRRPLIGLSSIDWNGTSSRPELPIADRDTDVGALNDISGVISPDGRRALVTHDYTLSEVMLPTAGGGSHDTFDLEAAQGRPVGAEAGAARRWGRALAPWISWSRDGRRVVFVQGGTLFLGDVRSGAWTSFRRIDVPLTVPVAIPRGTVVLRGARIITMRGLEVIPRGDIIVRDNRILALGPSGSVPIPPEATLMAFPGKTILPGYVDIHDHVTFAHGVHSGQCATCLLRLAYGVTTLRDPYAPQVTYNDIFAYRERERAGDLLAPRIFSTGIAHLRSDRAIADTAEAEALVRPTADYFGAETFKEYSGASRSERRMVVAAAGRAGLNATVHGDLHKAIFDGFSGMEHSYMTPLYADVLTLIAKSGVTQTETFGVGVGAQGSQFTTGYETMSLARTRRFTPPSARSEAVDVLRYKMGDFGHPEAAYLHDVLADAARITARGGLLGMGSHGLAGIGFHYEMWLHGLGGMRPMDILRAATINGATAIGHATDFGSLEPGKLADLQVLDSNPLVDIHHTATVRYVMKNGRMYLADDLTEVWPGHRALPGTYLYGDTRVSTHDSH